MVAGLLISSLVFGVVIGFMVAHNKNKELVVYAEKQQAVEALRDDYVSRDSFEFFEYAGVRGAADDSFADFERRRDEVLQRFRNRIID